MPTYTGRVHLFIQFRPPSQSFPQALLPSCPSPILQQGESLCFFEASERLLMTGEVLIGWVDRASGNTICNPPLKTVCVLSRDTVDVFVTVAWGGGEAQPGDWVPSDE